MGGGESKKPQCTCGHRFCRFDLWWQPLPLLRAPLTAFLVHDQSSDVDRWVLVDAGASDRLWARYATRLAAAVKRRLPPGEELYAVLCELGTTAGAACPAADAVMQQNKHSRHRCRCWQ